MRFKNKAGIRVFDILLAIAGLIATSWVIALCAILVRLGSPGPAIFAQSRIGRGERPFTCYKLRTMRNETPSAGTHMISSASVTDVGRVLRRTKLDELPQLWNVIIGDMSLVGPRPCLPVQSELIDARREHGVFQVRPGITGPAQIQGVDMSEPERLAVIDGSWVENMSLGAYLNAILQTVLGRGQGDRVASVQPPAKP